MNSEGTDFFDFFGGELPFVASELEGLLVPLVVEEVAVFGILRVFWGRVLSIDEYVDSWLEVISWLSSVWFESESYSAPSPGGEKSNDILEARKI